MQTDEDMLSSSQRQGAWERPVSTRLGEAIVALALLASGVFFMWHALSLDFGAIGLPGPGFFPFALGIALALLALAILVRALRGTNYGELVFLGHRDVVIAMLAMAGLAFAFERVDSYVALGGFTAVLLVLVARTQLWRVVLGTGLGMLAVWLFFGLALGVRLPTGEFWQQLADLYAAGSPFARP